MSCEYVFSDDVMCLNGVVGMTSCVYNGACEDDVMCAVV